MSTQIKLFGGSVITADELDKVSYAHFIAILGIEDRPRSRDLYQQYLMSQFDDVGMFLANFRGEG